MATGERVAAGVLREGLLVLGRGIRAEPRIFALSLLGSTAFGLLTVASALVTGKIVGLVVVPALDAGEVVPSSLALGGAALVGLSLLKVCGIFGRRLGAGLMQFRLQAAYRRRVTRRYLELPLSLAPPARHRHTAVQRQLRCRGAVVPDRAACRSRSARC